MDEPVAIQTYDPAWPVLFARERLAISSALGVAQETIYHVGSIAIPGMAAKPVIDIMIEIPTYPPDAAMIDALAELGYEHQGECGVAGRHWFRKGQPRSHHVHVVPKGGEVARRLLLLPEWLRTHPDDALEYERLKKSAAIGRTIDSHEYADAKTEIISRILVLAQR